MGWLNQYIYEEPSDELVEPGRLQIPMNSLQKSAPNELTRQFD